MTYPDLNKQIKEFGVMELWNGRLIKAYWITCKEDYNHDFYKIHHYIKEQEYYRFPERYKGQQKLIYMKNELHDDLHSAMSDKRFYTKHKIQKDILLYRPRKVEQ